MYLIISGQEALQLLRLIFNKAVACDDRSGIVVGDVVPGSSQDMSGAVCLSQCRIRVVNDRSVHFAGSQGCISGLVYAVGDQIHVIRADTVLLQHLQYGKSHSAGSSCGTDFFAFQIGEILYIIVCHQPVASGVSPHISYQLGRHTVVDTGDIRTGISVCHIDLSSGDQGHYCGVGIGAGLYVFELNAKLFIQTLFNGKTVHRTGHSGSEAGTDHDGVSGFLSCSSCTCCLASLILCGSGCCIVAGCCTAAAACQYSGCQCHSQ